MRILWILPFVPWPIKVRSFNLLPRLARRHQIDLVCIARSAEDRARLDAVRSHCSSVRTGTYTGAGAFARCLLSLPTRTPLRIAYVFSPSMCQAVAEAIAEKRPNVIYVERWRALQFVPQTTPIPIVCDPTDSMGLYNHRLMRGGHSWERVLGLLEYLKFCRYEPMLARRVAATVFCSRADLDFVRRATPDANLVQVPNGVDCESFSPKVAGEEQPGEIFFSGNFAYSPNRDAVRHFLKDTFPRVKRAVPEATFTIVGNGALKFMAGEAANMCGVRVFNFVPKLRPYLASASVAVAPLRLGAGVSNKLLEAFAVGTPIVSTRIGCGDLPCRDGEHLFIADEPALFADRIVQLIQDFSLRRDMAARAQVLVRTNYDWRIVARLMEDVLHKAVFGQGLNTTPSVIREPVAKEQAFAAAAD
ncbi:MAG TPA: glycosyltransferase [Terriglobales bacterium]|nr:glycosyltransferase [Terriglobales bacterium]